MRGRAETLATAAAIAAARDAVGEREGVWVVGGAVRDALLGRLVLDADLVVAGGEREVATAIGRAIGGPAFELSAEFRTWRAQAPDRVWHVDVTPVRGERLEDDLRLRDFTVNAVAVPLSDPGAAPIDPTGGIIDLDRRLLRAVSERSFADDPLRIMRAARLAAALDLTIDPATLELARAESHRAAAPAGERQLAELALLISGPHPVGGVRLLDELGATAAVLPELEALKGVEQNANHHLDVHGHTLEVLANVIEIERDLERFAGDAAPGVRELLAEPLADELTRGAALRLGALVHDFGKPATREEHGDGLATFRGHDRVGAGIVGEACARLRASRALTRHLEALTLHHLHLGFMAAECPLPRRRLYDYLKLTEPVAADVTLLTVADRLAARGTGPTAAPEMVEAHLELAREVLPDALAWHRSGAPRSPIPGDELAAAVGVEPGPRLGELIAEVEAAVFCGQVSTGAEAIAVARESLAESG
ncbi:MAG TPA: HD domain-containing protein [Solirubrobacterales bacterium]|nr:HD domain-containing protein [Solirubrobacterales bacterium]